MKPPTIASLLAQAERSPLGMARAYVSIGPCVLYLRVGRRLVGREVHQCLQIANVDVPEAEQHKGHFTRALAQCQATGLPIYMESVLNREFGDAMVRRGFRVIRDDMGLSRDLFLSPK